jgi:ankyrin repeat protein
MSITSYAPDDSLDADIIEVCIYGNVEEVEDLISRCADVNATDKNRNTPLHIASLNGHASVVDMLLKNGANVNATNKNMETPLHIASVRGLDSVVDILLKNDAI